MNKYLLIKREYNIADARVKDLDSTQDINIHTRAKPPESMNIQKFISNKQSIICKREFRYFVIPNSNISHNTTLLSAYKDAYFLI